MGEKANVRDGGESGHEKSSSGVGAGCWQVRMLESSLSFFLYLSACLSCLSVCLSVFWCFVVRVPDLMERDASALPQCLTLSLLARNRDFSIVVEISYARFCLVALFGCHGCVSSNFVTNEHAPTGDT